MKKSRSRFLSVYLVFSLVFLPSLARPLVAGDIAKRRAAASLFEKRCGSCHDAAEDSYQIFGPGWLPCANVEDGTCKDTPEQNAALIEKVIRAVNYQSGVKPMPPRKKGQLAKKDLDILEDWARAERNPPPAPPPAPLCEVASEPAPPGEHPPVTDAEAAAIMGNSCAGCHGKLGTLTTREKQALVGTALAGGFALAAIKGAQWVKERFFTKDDSAPAVSPELPTTRPSLKQLGCYYFASLSRDKFGLASKATIGGTAALSAFILATSQGARHAHIKGKTFNNGDELDPVAVAKGDLSLAKFHASVVSGTMPVDVPDFPERALIHFSVGYPTDEERSKLGAWLKQLQETKLTAGCLIYTVNDELSYGNAARRCNAMGMRIPTAAQLAALAGQQEGKSFPGEGCVWSSGFSDDPKAPRQAYFIGKGLGPQTTAASCKSVCLR